MDSQGIGESRDFFAGIAWRNVAQLYRATGFEKRNFKATLIAKRFFDRVVITFYYNLRKHYVNKQQQRDSVSTTGFKQRAEEDKILAKIVGKQKESGREEGEKIIVKPASRLETELE